MTEEHWFNGSDLDGMIEHSLALAVRVDRRMRLFALAACEYSAKLTLTRDYSQLWDEAACLIDNQPFERQRDEGTRKPFDPWETRIVRQIRAILPPREVPTSFDWWQHSLDLLAQECINLQYPIEMQRWRTKLHFIAILRDIFGNPFRPVALDPRWLTSSVLDLANGIYEDRAFERMPILADALMDAGCANDEIITHCRGDGPHVRGCWVVDLILGKE